MFSHGKRLDESYPLSCTDAALRDAEMMAPSRPSAASSSPLKKARSVDFLGRLSIRSASLTEGPLSTAASQFSRRAARGVYSNGYVCVREASLHHCCSCSLRGPVGRRHAAKTRSGDELTPSLNFLRLTWFVPNTGIITAGWLAGCAFGSLIDRHPRVDSVGAGKEALRSLPRGWKNWLSQTAKWRPVSSNPSSV
jgi:hypothetical protein